MDEQAMRLRLGIFVLAALILLAVMITLFGGFPNYFKKTNPFTIEFSNAQGVAPGTPVKRSGVRIGEVRSLKLDNDTGKVAVDIEVDQEYTLRKSDQPTLTQSLLGGDTAISFLPPDDPRKVDPTPVPPGSVLQGVNPTDAQTLVQRTGELMPPAQEALVEIKKFLQKFDKLLPVMDDTFREFQAMGRATREMIPELRKTNDEFRALATDTRKTLPEFKRTSDEIQELAREARKALPDLKRTSDEVQITARQWGKVGERVDLLVHANEDKITKSLTRLEDTLKRASEVLSDENQKNVRDILRNTKAGSERLDAIGKGAEEMIKDAQKFLKRVEQSLTRADDVLVNMQKATKPLAERAPAILKNVDESADKLNRTLSDLRDVIQAVARGDGSLQKLLSDPALYNNINDSAEMMTKILPRVDRILRDVEIFADKIARHPESLGIGGVVRPGTGLKESPTVFPWRVPGH